MHPSPHKGREKRPSIARVEVFRVADGTAWNVLALAGEYGGCFTHYTKGGSAYCDPDDCQASLHRTQRYWKGYFPAQVYDELVKKWVFVVFELTENSELDVRDRLKRGQVWRFSRPQETTSKRLPVSAELVQERSPADLPPAFDMMPALCRIFRRIKLDLSHPNPMPPRLSLKPSDAPPPPGMEEGPGEASRPTQSEIRAMLAQNGISLRSARNGK